MSKSTDQKEGKNTKKFEAKVIVLETDMEDGMLMYAIDIVQKNYDENISNHEIASILKKDFESKYYPTWICIVGKSYGCKIECQKKHYLCFQVENKTIILYKFN